MTRADFTQVAQGDFKICHLPNEFDGKQRYIGIALFCIHDLTN